MDLKIQPSRHRYPYCIVWTPIPILSWLIPLIGHMGICTSAGVVRDFAGPYTIGEDEMAFGWPTKLWQLSPALVQTDSNAAALDWDSAVNGACDVYRGRMHNLLCDNCHSHAALALNLMHYNNCRSWNMVKLFFVFTLHSRYVSWASLVQTWLSFCILAIVVICFSAFLRQ
ncbi:hypothetical protein BOX15_Mlig017626g2 [Macrostomum lignano]|uniref:Uncharacterized protein n=2 Tax=Macrostomum lignano TaxID=282301 RepID=A0A267DR79_9PLAT|nr:hypothetical protein BOX15_Mlig017626g2 [Macrostomum lignano]